MQGFQWAHGCEDGGTWQQTCDFGQVMRRPYFEGLFNTCEKQFRQAQCHEIGTVTEELCTGIFLLFFSDRGRWWDLALRGPGFLAFLNVLSASPRADFLSVPLWFALHPPCSRSVFSARHHDCCPVNLGNVISVCRKQLAYFSRKCSWSTPVSLFLRPGSMLLLFVTLFSFERTKTFKPTNSEGAKWQLEIILCVLWV